MPPDELTDTTASTTESSGSEELTGLTTTSPALPAGGEGQQLTTPDPTGGTAAPAAWESIIQSIPDTDDDLQAPTFQHVQGLQEQRKQLRVLRDAVREMQPAQERLKAYQGLGEPTAIRSAVDLLNLLYSPVLDKNGEAVTDPATQTTYVTTKPWLDYLDEHSPGMPEQLLVDLLDFAPRDENGQLTPKLKYQVLRWWQLDPARIDDYRNIDKHPSFISRAVTKEELADIPPEFHDAYRNLPPSVRNAWAAYDDADQQVLLRNEKDRLDNSNWRQQQEESVRQQKERETQEYLAILNQEQARYFAVVRQERFASIAKALHDQIIFSTEPTTNAVMHGAVGTVLANLIDPDLRFVSTNLLTALGVKLDHTFDAALNDFNVNGRDYVAQALQGDEVRAGQAQERANAAANLLTTKLGIIALKVAKAMGGQQQAAAAAQGNALAAATTGRPGVGNGTSPNGSEQGILPAHIRPGSPEATRYLAESTGFWRT